MGKTALIVDDSRTARLVLQRVLETHDLGVDNAESAEDALAYLSDNRPDIIFMDHAMPGMDGFEAVSAIKNNPSTATIPIMMYTAQEGEVYVGQARALGAVGVLPKQVEPVEVSKVLENLHIIGEDAEKRSAIAETRESDAGGEYPGLERVDQDLSILLQDLFDQQRAILRRDMLNSHEVIAARVAEEIRTQESDDSEAPPPGPRFAMPGSVTGAAIAVVVIAVVFAGLFWQSWQALQDAQQRNSSLQNTLDAQIATDTIDAIQTDRQLDEYQTALDTAYSVALDSIEWAANQSSLYELDEVPMSDFRLSVIEELSGHLAALDFQGLVRIETHVGNFCMSFAGSSGYQLAPDSLPALQCDQIGFDSIEAYELGLRTSVAFSNFISLASERNDGRIRYEIISFGNLNPLVAYPAVIAGVSASEWNEVAASNNRADVSLYPDGR